MHAHEGIWHMPADLLHGLLPLSTLNELTYHRCFPHPEMSTLQSVTSLTLDFSGCDMWLEREYSENHAHTMCGEDLLAVLASASSLRKLSTVCLLSASGSACVPSAKVYLTSLEVLQMKEHQQIIRFALASVQAAPHMTLDLTLCWNHENELADKSADGSEERDNEYKAFLKRARASLHYRDYLPLQRAVFDGDHRLLHLKASPIKQSEDSAIFPPLSLMWHRASDSFTQAFRYAFTILGMSSITHLVPAFMVQTKN
jgi:hypothetical protein